MRGGEFGCSRLRTVPPGFEPGCSPSAETKPFVLPELSNVATRYNVADVMRSEMKMNVDCQPVVCEPRICGGMCVSNGFRDNYLCSHVNERKMNSEAPPFYSQQLNDEIKRHEPPRQLAPSSSRDPNEFILRTYLDGQGRSEYINLASQIAYDGSNITFVFYENQIRRLMEESSYDDRKLEVLRASCVGQPREMVNLFCALMKNMSTNQRIEKAIDRLRQRYGVSGGLTSEPKVVAVRKGPKVAFNSTSLKLFNENLNTLEVFAHAHNEVEKLSGQLMLDTANRLPGTLKRRYLDYLDKMRIDLNQPSFESLRSFVVHEIQVRTSDYAQAFFKSDEREVQRERSCTGSKTFRVRQVDIEEGINSRSDQSKSRVVPDAEKKKLSVTSERSVVRRFNNKPPPICFFCSSVDSKHFLADCDNFKRLSPELKRKTVIDAKRCLNCLSLEHFVRHCHTQFKCGRCGPQCRNKHASALDECYATASESLGAAADEESAPIPAPRSRTKPSGKRDVNVRKVNFDNNRVVLLRTSSVKIVNPHTGELTLAYAQHDTASQATLISENLKNELRLESTPDPSVMIRTLADGTVPIGGRTDFVIESLYEDFDIEGALVVPQFSNDEGTLPHAVDITTLEHFNGEQIEVVPERKRIEILIGQSDKTLLAILDEYGSANPEELITYLPGWDLSPAVGAFLLLLTRARCLP